MTLRAKTYETVARGDCPHCGDTAVDLRFVYNPYDDDMLVCLACGELHDQAYHDSGAS